MGVVVADRAIHLGQQLDVRNDGARAAQAGEAPDFVPLVRGWGGVTVAYRKRMVDSPAYRLNHEEIIKALEEGISFTETLNPVEAVADEFGALKDVIFAREGQEGQAERAGQEGLSTVTLPARTLVSMNSSISG